MKLIWLQQLILLLSCYVILGKLTPLHLIEVIAILGTIIITLYECYKSYLEKQLIAYNYFILAGLCLMNVSIFSLISL